MNSIIVAYFLSLPQIKNKPALVIIPIPIVKVRKWVPQFERDIIVAPVESVIERVTVNQDDKCFVIGGLQ